MDAEMIALAKAFSSGSGSGSDGLGLPVPADGDVGKVPVVQDDLSYALQAMSGGTGVKWETIADITTEEEVTNITINKDANGNSFSLVEAEILVSIATTDSNTRDAALSIRTNANTAAEGCTNTSASRIFRSGTGNCNSISMRLYARSGVIAGIINNIGNVGANTAGYFNPYFETLTALFLSGGTFGVGSHIVIKGVRA